MCSNNIEGTISYSVYSVMPLAAPLPYKTLMIVCCNVVLHHKLKCKTNFPFHCYIIEIIHVISINKSLQQFKYFFCFCQKLIFDGNYMRF